jgi:AAA domain/Bifunctional DNA primase/polymerase, N-terminal
VADDLDEFEELPECEPAWMRLDRATAFRKGLLAAGYLPLPVNGKAPPIAGWQDIQATNILIDKWAYEYAEAKNTGILTRTTPAIDIDVLDPTVADELQQLAERMIGISTVRIGRAPKRALLFRADAPFSKISTPVFVSPDGRTHQVEVLSRGQQIVVHGIHPTTHASYTWRGAEPGPELKRDALPLLSAEKASEFITAAAQCMAAHCWTPKKKPNGDAGAGGFLDTQKPTTERERLYAGAALDGCADELAQAPSGERNDTLNKKAFRLGTMVARGWISSAEVFDALFAAAASCGLNADDGEEATRKTLQSGLDDGIKRPHPDLDADQQDTFTEPPTSNSWKYHTGAAPLPLRWLIKGILPETGAALVAGQWGTFKTTVALDVSVCVMAQLSFAGRYRVKRRGAILYIALEGESMLSARLAAIAGHRGVSGPLPFAWRGDCPALTNKNATTELCALADEAAADLYHNFSLPVVLIWIDTVITAAGYSDGGDNDTAAAQKVMSALRILSKHTGALVTGIDHFGKVIETGTRGSSAKEGAADTVLAVLADRELSGGVRNTRLAVRKQRDGVSGFEIPFTARMVETGTDDDGDPVTAPVIEWQATQQTPQDDTRWTPSMQILRRVLMTILADCGRNVRPFLDGPEVRACDIELVRTEFYKQYPADGTGKQKADARRKAFGRSVKETVARSLVASREVEGVQLIWLTKPDATSV